MSTLSLPRWLIGLFFALALLGFMDATYLTASHYLGFSLNCRIFEGCNTVTTSAYSMIGGVSVALLGALYYTTIVFGLVAYFDSRKLTILKFLADYTTIGFLMSLYFLGVQAFILHALCIYCLLSAISSIALFITGRFIARAITHHRLREAESAR